MEQVFTLVFSFIVDALLVMMCITCLMKEKKKKYPNKLNIKIYHVFGVASAYLLLYNVCYCF